MLERPSSVPAFLQMGWVGCSCLRAAVCGKWGTCWLFPWGCWDRAESSIAGRSVHTLFRDPFIITGSSVPLVLFSLVPATV